MARGIVASAGRFAVVCLLAGGLGGCYTMGKGGGSSGGGGATPKTPTPAPFTTFIGSFTGKSVITGGTTNQFTNNTKFDDTVGKPAANAKVEVYAGETSSVQRAYVTGVAPRSIESDTAKIESNGSAIRGSVVNSANTWAMFSNSPGSRLDSSLGAQSLQHSYTGVAYIGAMRAGTTGDTAFSVAGIFGGNSTTDMPTSGKADFAGGFEGMENSALTGLPMQVSNISGKANLSADFAAKSVRGRIDDVSNHNLGPIKQAAGYSIGFDGSMTGSSFSGRSWLTQPNSDAPLAYFGQNSGTVQGGFFGPGAAETAGALGVSAVNEYKKILVTGAFGAKKK